MVKAEHFEVAAPGLASRLDVRLRIDQEPVRIVGRVPRSNGLSDGRATAEQQPATLGRSRLARVRDNVFEHFTRDPAFTIHNSKF